MKAVFEFRLIEGHRDETAGVTRRQGQVHPREPPPEMVPIAIDEEEKLFSISEGVLTKNCAVLERELDDRSEVLIWGHQGKDTVASGGRVGSIPPCAGAVSAGGRAPAR